MAIPETVADLDAAIAAEHAAAEAAIDSCQSGVAQWHVEQIARLEDLRPAIEAGTPALHELVRARRRGLGEKYARACWGGNDGDAARLLTEIERLERGRP